MELTIGEIKNKLCQILDCRSISTAQAELRRISSGDNQIEFNNFMNLLDSEPGFELLLTFPKRDKMIFTKATMGDLQAIAIWIGGIINSKITK